MEGEGENDRERGKREIGGTEAWGRVRGGMQYQF